MKFLLALICLTLCGCGFLEGVRQSNNKETVTGLYYVSYVCYADGQADSVGWRIVEAPDKRAAQKQFHKERENCRITNIEKRKT